MLSVINYHYVRHDFSQPFPAFFGMTPDMFSKQLQFLGKKGVFIHPDDLLENSNEILAGNGNFYLVTFDDGLREQAEIALPILDDLSIPALFFINSINFTESKVSLVHKIHLVRSQVNPATLVSDLQEFTGKKLNAEASRKAQLFYRFDTVENAEIKYQLNVVMDLNEVENFISPIFKQHFSERDTVRELYMDISQLKKLRSRNLLGNHTHSHLVLGNYGVDKIKDEIIQTRNFINTLEEKETAFISYPYGTKQAVSDVVAKVAAQTGHKFGFTTTPGINDSITQNLELKRFDCNDLPAS